MSASFDHNATAVKVVETADGSMTLYDTERRLHYRATWGAASESRQVFIDGSGLFESPPPWTVLELGFGAGVNFAQAVASLVELPSGRLVYHTVDHAPVDASHLAFHEGEAGRLARRALREAKRQQHGRVCGLEGRVALHLHTVSWRDFERPGLEADAVFFDPFGPKNEPGSWTPACFEVARRHMAPDAILATYSAATNVKRAMFSAGFAVASAPGAGPKREVTFASKSRQRLAGRPDLSLLDRDRYVEGDRG